MAPIEDNQPFPPIEVRRIAPEETVDIRHRVMWPDRPRSDVLLPGDQDALHFGAILSGTLIGVGSFFQDGAAYRLRKLAVEPAFQGKGIASTLIEVATQHLRTNGCTSIWCDARLSASEFYARIGFRLDPRVFQKNGLDYVVATLDL